MSPFLESVQQALAGLTASAADPYAPMLAHADVFRARAAITNTSDPNLMLERHMGSLLTIAGERALFLPVFNYDYPRSRVYDVAEAPSQVGVLTEHARQNMPGVRCGPPIFNFFTNATSAVAASLAVAEAMSGAAQAAFDMAVARVSGLPCNQASASATAAPLVLDPFGSDTVFGLIHRADGVVMMYGAPFNSFTAIHYIERLSGGPLYRYDKLFPGKVLHGNGVLQPVVLDYHCRPMGKSLEYDWARLRAEVEEAGILKSVKVPGSEVLLINLAQICSFWLEKLKADPLYLLDAQSRAWVEPELARLGRRFVVSDFEGAA